MAEAATNGTNGANGATKRFLGWQKTPIHQASFGSTTKGGSQNTSFKMIHSTGSVQHVDSKWYLVDASEAPVGRVATTVALLLMGKYKPTFTLGADSGDSVIVINADKAYFTSNKSEKKMYYWHTLYMGGLKSETAGQALTRRPEKVIWQAVQGMMPKNKLSRYQLARLKIYKGDKHSHQAQKPALVSVKDYSLKKLGVT